MSSVNRRSARWPGRQTLLAAFALACITAGCDKAPSFDDSFAKAKQAQARGDTATAIIELKNALQTRDNSAEVRYLLGMAYLDAGDSESAEKELRRALDLQKDPALVQPPLAKSMLLQGKFSQILQEFKKSSNPTVSLSPELASARGMAQLFLGDAETAQASFEAALVQSPGFPDALLGQARLAAAMGEPERALTLADQALEKAPRNLDALLLKGDVHRLLGRNNEALAAYVRAVEAHPENLTARLDLSSAYIESNRLDEAAKQVTDLLRISPQSPLANYVQAMIEFKKYNLAQAREAIQRVLNVTPTHLPSQLLGGVIESELGNYMRGEQYLRSVIERAPRNLYARKLWIVSLMRTQQGVRAMEALQPALRQAPDDSKLLALAGEVYLQNGELAKATQFFDKAAKADPKNAKTLAGLGLSRLAGGDSVRALADLESSIGLDAQKYQADVLMVMTSLARADYTKAAEAAASLEKKQPDHPLTYNLKAAVLLASKKPGEARASLEKALQLQPTYFPAAMNLAQLDLREKNPAAAKKRFEDILAKDANNLQALMALAGLGESLGARQEESLGWLDRARKANPTAPQPPLKLSQYYLQKGDIKTALDFAKAAHSAAPENPEVLEQLGLAQLAADEANSATITFGKLLTLQPKSALVLYRLGSAQAANGNPAAAALNFQKALELNPDLLEALTALGLIDANAGRYAEAMKIVNRIQRKLPKSPTGYVLEGDVRTVEQNYPQAIALYKKAFELEKSAPIAIKIHAALTLAGKKDEAEATVLGWIKGHPEDLAVRLYLADAGSKAGKPATAAEQYEYISRKQPENLLAWNNLAWAYYEMKDPRAVAAAEKAMKLAPEDPMVMDTYGWILINAGRLDKGMDLLRTAASLAPGKQEIRYHYALGLLKTGDKNGGQRELEKIVSSGPNFPQQAEAKALLKQLQE